MVQQLKACLTVLTLVQLSAVGLFLWGFLLAKVELTDSSSTRCGPARRPAIHKVVWIVLDGLRYDFAASQAAGCGKEASKHLPVFCDLITEMVRDAYVYAYL